MLKWNNSYRYDCKYLRIEDKQMFTQWASGLLRSGIIISHSLKKLSHQPKPLSMNISHTKISVLLISASQVRISQTLCWQDEYFGKWISHFHSLHLISMGKWWKMNKYWNDEQLQMWWLVTGSGQVKPAMKTPHPWRWGNWEHKCSFTCVVHRRSRLS